jgi:hypothetical protein
MAILLRPIEHEQRDQHERHDPERARDEEHDAPTVGVRRELRGKDARPRRRENPRPRQNRLRTRADGTYSVPTSIPKIAIRQSIRRASG